MFMGPLYRAGASIFSQAPTMLRSLLTAHHATGKGNRAEVGALRHDSPRRLVSLSFGHERVRIVGLTRLASCVVCAEGLLELGLFTDAWEELDGMEPSEKAHPEVLLLRLDVLLGLSRWDDAAALGTGCCRDWGSFDRFFLKTAKALRNLDQHDKAFEILRYAPTSLHRDPEYHYAMACCACRLGELKVAKEALHECFRQDKTFRQRGLDDPALEPVWASLG